MMMIRMMIRKKEEVGKVKYQQREAMGEDEERK